MPFPKPPEPVVVLQRGAMALLKSSHDAASCIQSWEVPSAPPTASSLDQDTITAMSPLTQNPGESFGSGRVIPVRCNPHTPSNRRPLMTVSQ